MTSGREGPPGKWEILLLVAVLLLATVLRIGWPSLTEFKFSEARLEALALELTQEGRIPLVGVPSSAGFDHSPISVYLYLPAFLLSSDPIPATIYGGLAGVVAVALCWWLARRWPGGGRWAAMTGTLVFAVSPWSVAFSRKIWQVAFVPLLTLSFIGLLISALVEEPDSNPSKRQQWRLAWSILVYALLVQVHPSAIALAPAWVLWLIVFWRRVRLGPLLVGGLLGILTAAPFLLHQTQSGWPVLASLRSLQGAVWDLSSVQLSWEAISGRSIHALAGDAYPLLGTVPRLDRLFNLVGWMAVAASLGLIWRAFTRWHAAEPLEKQAARVDVVLLSWLMIPIVFNLRHSLELHLHFFALIAPAAYLIIGRGAEQAVYTVQARIPKWFRPLAAAGAAVLGVLALSQVLAIILMGRFVATHDTPGGFGLPLAHYLKVADETIEMAHRTDAAEVLVVGLGDSIVVDPTPAVFDALLRGKITYRFVDGESAAVFPANRSVVLLAPDSGEAAEWYGAWPAHHLQDGYRLVALDGSWPQDHPQSVDSLESIAGPRTFQNGIEFQNYAWQRDQEGRGRLWLQWQVLWLSQEDSHFYAQVLDPAEQSWGQQDSVGYPTESRRKGDRILTKFDINKERGMAGDPYWGRSGLYLYPQVVPIPVIDEAGNPVGDAVVVGPLSGK
jgi:hypothetical protein